MDKALNFLNSADLDALTAISGVSRELAERLIAARPFNSVEASLNVEGMSEELLANVKASAETDSVEERVLIKAEEKFSAPERPAKESPANNKPSAGARLGNALRSFIRALVKLVIIVLVFGAIGAAAYFGWPLLREKYLAPIEQNSARVAQLESQTADLQNQLTEINNRLASVETSIEAHTASITKLEDMQSSLDKQLKESNDATLVKLNQEIKMTRVLDMLARARLYLSQSNFGLAKEDIQSARDLLVELQSQSGDAAQAQAVSRLDLALSNLPEFPVIASGDAEIAWRILMTGKAPPTATPQPSPTATLTAEPTLEATATP
ncbi:MAG: helix-hairpin-helix domain-containing protein [Anaerolineaceae bacterium]|jgi:cell division protein FtsB|nr:helix-hairpin-helix domain-containing protein [Anaerolineaceae bacterium]OQY88590.1 MAG: hypothetical protein B6D38_09495 [Anaerolineae bacterium UTCFX1]